MTPVLKWVGGKTQIMPKIISKIPKTMNNFHEPFVGGGSVLLSVLSLVQTGKISIYTMSFSLALHLKIV